jgi:nucleoside-specific outer membrane channel protein Tsx
MKKLSLLALGLAALVTPLSAADWSDTSIQYRNGSDFQEPGNPSKLKKDIFNLSHVSGYSLGSNFFSVDMLTSERKDPANTAGTFGGAGSEGAHEVYVAYRHNLNLAKVFNTNIEFGPVKGIDFTAGFDFAAKNTPFAPAVYKILAGPTFNFKVPGFLSVGLLYYKEKNHNGFGSGKAPAGGGLDVSFDPTYMVSAAWGIPVALGPVNTSVKGFATFTGAKGRDGSAVDTKPETLARIYWMADFSPLVGCKKGTWQIGPGFEYWDNKFGDPTYATVADAAGGNTTVNGIAVKPSVNPKTTGLMFAIEAHF